MHEEGVEKVLNILEMISCEGDNRCLGLLTMVGRSKKQIFEYIKDRVAKEVRGWKETLFSQTGKEVLIKLVLQAIPI